MNPIQIHPGMIRLLSWLLWGAWRAQPLRWLVALFTVALGVALGVAVHTVNRSALIEFSRAVDQVNGNAPVQIVSPLGRSLGFDDQTFDALFAQRGAHGVRAMSPVLELATDKVLLLGIDLFRAAAVSPALLPEVGSTAAQTDSGSSLLFSDDAVFLSAQALSTLGLRIGDPIALLHGDKTVSLRIAGMVPGVVGQPLAVMDLGLAQWLFDQQGKISRIDLAITDRFDAQQFGRYLQTQGYSLAVVQARERSDRLSHLSRAYRVNLTVLALVALLTGSFLVYTAMGLSVLRQQSQLALLRALGAPRSFSSWWVVSQALVICGVGGLAGVLLGLALAKGLLGFFGGDLGGGYFGQYAPPMVVEPLSLSLFWLVAAALGLASAIPALVRLQTEGLAMQLRAGRSETLQPARWTLLGALILLVLALVFAFSPAIGGLPLFGYAAIASLLFAGVMLVPWILAVVLPVFLKVSGASLRAGSLGPLVQWRLTQAPAAASSVTAGVVAAVSLTVAMAIMVSSFRDSVSQWLDQVLPADIYSSAATGEAAIFTESHAAALQAISGVQRVERTRQIPVLWAPDQPEVMLIARRIDWQNPQRSLPLVGQTPDAAASHRSGPGAGSGVLHVFVSEAMVDRYAMLPGRQAQLPLTDPASGAAVKVWVAGVFRDYGRQHGAVVLASEDYERLTGDRSKTGFSVWVAPGVSVEQVMREIRGLGGVFSEVRLISAEALRALSLKIFDRSFAMTYALELAALVVALFAVASGFTAQVIVRRKEFALLAQLGQSLPGRLALVGAEACLLLTLAVAWGGLLGLAMSQILIHRVNPQSFHWTMDTSLPVTPLIALALGVVGLGLAAAVLATRRLLQAHLLSPALKEDW